jgi:hypothetical protein
MSNYPKLTGKMDTKFLEPPDELDGAEVLLWAYSPDKPFFMMKYTDGGEYRPIHGFAICRYKGSDTCYKFSCDRNWNVVGDMDAASLEEAMDLAQSQSPEPITWHNKSE